MLHDVGKRTIGNEIKHDSARRYSLRVILRVNKEEGNKEVQKRKTRICMIKLQALAKGVKRKSITCYPGLCSKRSIACITISITKKKEMLICYSQACQNTNNPKKLTKKSKTHVIIMITISLYYNKLSSILISMISNKVNKEIKDSRDNYDNDQPILQ